ncbi:MAG: hypothetical protein ACK5NG_08365 [Chthoniobacterales bacterium]
MAGLHRIEIEDGGNLTFLHWPTSQKLAIPAGQEDCAELNARYSLYFFVPKGTQNIGGYGTQNGRILDADGQEIFALSKMEAPGYFDIPVPKGQDGKIWKINQGQGKTFLMTVPPYLSPNKDSLLVPAEVKPDE